MFIHVVHLIICIDCWICWAKRIISVQQVSISLLPNIKLIGRIEETSLWISKLRCTINYIKWAKPLFSMISLRKIMEMQINQINEFLKSLNNWKFRKYIVANGVWTPCNYQWDHYWPRDFFVDLMLWEDYLPCPEVFTSFSFSHWCRPCVFGLFWWYQKNDCIIDLMFMLSISGVR